jgi:hypothetical protein
MNELILLITYLSFEVLEQITHNKLFGIIASIIIIILGLVIILEKGTKEHTKEGFVYMIFGIVLSILKIKNYNESCSSSSGSCSNTDEEHYKNKKN